MDCTPDLIILGTSNNERNGRGISHIRERGQTHTFLEGRGELKGRGNLKDLGTSTSEAVVNTVMNRRVA